MDKKLFLFILPVSLHAICPEGYVNMYNGKCFLYRTVSLTFDEARQRCQADGGDLASIHNKEENEFIVAKYHTGYQAWLGLQPGSGDENDTNARWLDGTPLDYRNFEHYGVNPSTFNPAQRLNARAGDGIWDWRDAERILFSNCIVAQDIPSGPCELNYSLLEELGICARTVAEEKSWNDAESACQADNAHLVSIHDKDTNSYIRRLALSNQFTNNLHIGLKTSTSGDGVLTSSWTDSSTFNYNNYLPGMPNPIFGNCTAMEIHSATGDWVSIFCDESAKFPFFCAKHPLCSGSVHLLYEGDAYSPDYPSSPSRDLNCEYFLAANNGSSIIIEFDEIQLVNDDQIILYDGEATQIPMAVIHGGSEGKKYVTQTSSIMRMVYMTGKTVGIRKWHARFGNF